MYTIYLAACAKAPGNPAFILSTQQTLIPIGSKGLHYWANVEKTLLHLNTKDRILCTRSPAYDARISEYVRAFAAHGTLVLLPQSERKDFDCILKACETHRITCLILIASQLRDDHLEDLIQEFAKTGLKHLMVTGDACSLRLKNACQKANITLWNCYGPTELTFGLSIVPVTEITCFDENNQEVVPLGMPYGNDIKVHVIQGRLYIESPYLSKGYINNTEVSKKNFPILMIDGKPVRLFDTEDEVTLTKNNLLIFRGRAHQKAHCKISGVKFQALK